MLPTPKTIQIFLPSGDPRGIRIAEITTRIVQVIEVPRSLLQEFVKMPESNQVSLYFLVGETDDGSEPRVYIGQTGDLRTRLANHNKNKDFWQRAVVFISRTNSLTQTHTLFLEWYSLQEAKKADRYANENGNSGSKPHTPAPLEADCLEIFDTGRTLLATLGYPVFDPVATPQGQSSQIDESFYCKTAGINGQCLYTPEGFVVLKGSRGRRANVPSLTQSNQNFRQKLIDTGIMIEDGNDVEFIKDHLFNSPSYAALALLGSTANGWVEWKSKDGITLDKLKRQPPKDQA